MANRFEFKIKNGMILVAEVATLRMGFEIDGAPQGNAPNSCEFGYIDSIAPTVSLSRPFALAERDPNIETDLSNDADGCESNCRDCDTPRTL